MSTMAWAPCLGTGLFAGVQLAGSRQKLGGGEGVTFDRWA